MCSYLIISFYGLVKQKQCEKIFPFLTVKKRYQKLDLSLLQTCHDYPITKACFLAAFIPF